MSRPVFIALSSICAFAMPSLALAADASSTGRRAHPCAPFVSACLKAGFELRGGPSGNQLVADCLNKLIKSEAGTASSPVSSKTGRMALSPAQANAAACAAKHAAL